MKVILKYIFEGIYILPIILLNRFEVYAQKLQIERRDTAYINLNDCPDFKLLSGLIEECKVWSSEKRVWIQPINKGFCGSSIKPFFFTLGENTLQNSSIIGLPQKLLKTFKPENALQINETGNILWFYINSPFIVISDSKYRYVNHKPFPKNPKNHFLTNEGQNFILRNDLYIPLIPLKSTKLRTNKFETSFGRVSISDILSNGQNRLQYTNSVDAFPCNFPNDYFFWFDRSYYSDNSKNELFFMDIRRSKLTEFQPEHNSYLSYIPPNQVFMNNTNYIYLDKIDTSYSVKTNIQPHDKVITNYKDEIVGYVELNKFQIISNSTKILFKESYFWTNDSVLIEESRKLSLTSGFEISKCKPVFANYHIFHIYEFIQLTPITKLIKQIIVPRGQNIYPTSANLMAIEGVKMIADEINELTPAIITWKLGDSGNE